MSKLWQGAVRTIFWSYERGSWPYDVMVLAILVFVLLTPRAWFHDRPQPNPPSQTSVHLLSQASGGLQTYRVDAKLLAAQKRSAKKTPELERQIHDVLGHNVDDLKGQTFQVVRIVPVREDNGGVASYDVTIRR